MRASGFEHEVDRGERRTAFASADERRPCSIRVGVGEAIAAQLGADDRAMPRERHDPRPVRARRQRRVIALLCAEAELAERIVQRLLLDEHEAELARQRRTGQLLAVRVTDDVDRIERRLHRRHRLAAGEPLILPRDANAAVRRRARDPDARRDVDLIERIVRARQVAIVLRVERRAVVAEVRVVAGRALIADRRRRHELVVPVRVAVVQPHVTRAERAEARRCGDAIAVIVAAESRDEVQRAADARTAELDGHRAAIQLDLAEVAEREAAEIGRHRRDACERHAVDQDLGVARRRTAHGHRLVRAEPAERMRLRADRRADCVCDRSRRVVIVGMDDRDERRVAECTVAIARRGRRIGIGRPIDDDDRFARITAGRLRICSGRRDEHEHESERLHRSPHVTTRVIDGRKSGVPSPRGRDERGVLTSVRPSRRLPSVSTSGWQCPAASSPVTVAGAVPVSHWLPCIPSELSFDRALLRGLLRACYSDRALRCNYYCAVTMSAFIGPSTPSSAC